jgi:hypothetical protein
MYSQAWALHGHCMGIAWAHALNSKFQNFVETFLHACNHTNYLKMCLQNVFMQHAKSRHEPSAMN